MSAAPQSAPESDSGWTAIRFRAGDAGIDESYQTAARFNPKKAQRIADEWDWRFYDPVQLGQYPDGRVVIVDGQHRVHAARLHFGDDVELDGFIRETTPNEAARMFAEQDRNRTRVNVAIKYNAARLYGDPETLLIDAIAERNGWTVSTTGSSSSRAITCVAALQRVVRTKDGDQRLDRCLRVATAAWGHQKAAASHYVIGGLARFCRDYGEKADDGRLIDRLRTVSPEEVIGPMARKYALELGRGNQASTQNYYPVALVIRDLYNYRLTKNRQLGRDS